MSTVLLNDVAATGPPPEPQRSYNLGAQSGGSTAAGDSCSQQLEEELRQLAVQQAAVDDLNFAYQLQLEEVLQASSGRPDIEVSARMFAPESEECLHRRAAVEAQVCHGPPAVPSNGLTHGAVWRCQCSIQCSYLLPTGATAQCCYCRKS